MNIYVIYITANPGMVEMVLLGVSGILDVVWIDCITIWRYKEGDRDRGNSGGVLEKLLWNQA